MLNLRLTNFIISGFISGHGGVGWVTDSSSVSWTTTQRTDRYPRPSPPPSHQLCEVEKKKKHRQRGRNMKIRWSRVETCFNLHEGNRPSSSNLPFYGEEVEWLRTSRPSWFEKRELGQVDEVIGGVYQLIIWLYLPSIIVIIIETMVVSFL